MNMNRLCVLNSVAVGLGAGLVQAAPSTISVTWIPQRQRTLATALQMLANQLGNAFGFFLGVLALVSLCTVPEIVNKTRIFTIFLDTRFIEGEVKIIKCSKS